MVALSAQDQGYLYSSKASWCGTILQWGLEHYHFSLNRYLKSCRTQQVSGPGCSRTEALSPWGEELSLDLRQRGSSPLRWVVVFYPEHGRHPKADAGKGPEVDGSFDLGNCNSPGLRGQPTWPCEPHCSISKLSWLQFSSPSRRSSETREGRLFPRRLTF